MCLSRVGRFTYVNQLETAHLHQSNSQLLLSRTRLVIQSMINLDSCYKEKFMVTWPRAYVKLQKFYETFNILIHIEDSLDRNVFQQ